MILNAVFKKGGLKAIGIFILKCKNVSMSLTSILYKQDLCTKISFRNTLCTATLYFSMFVGLSDLLNLALINIDILVLSKIHACL